MPVNRSAAISNLLKDGRAEARPSKLVQTADRADVCREGCRCRNAGRNGSEGTGWIRREQVIERASSNRSDTVHVGRVVLQREVIQRWANDDARGCECNLLECVIARRSSAGRGRIRDQLAGRIVQDEDLLRCTIDSRSVEVGKACCEYRVR